MTHRPLPTDLLSTIADYIRWGSSRFNEAGIFYGHGTTNATDEAATLVLHAIFQPHDLGTGYFGCVLTMQEREAAVALIERRIRDRVPAAYITHESWFCGLPFFVDERVLVPRSPIGELIEQQFAPWISDPGSVTRILDLCTGSGCIAIASALAFSGVPVDAVDISVDALAVARINIGRHGVDDQVELLAGDLFQPLQGRRYDLIISNPPYVNSEEWRNLPAEYHAEPKLGLESGENGLDCVRQILRDAPSHLTPNGILIVEVGSSAEALEAAFPNLPFCWIEFQRGGDGVFVLTAEQLQAHRKFLI
jgi:ribosomal protein L3 glutamine methyltransferase